MDQNAHFLILVFHHYHSLINSFTLFFINFFINFFVVFIINLFFVFNLFSSIISFFADSIWS